MAAAQLSLALDFVPDPVRDHGLRAAHPRPLVSLGKRSSGLLASFRTSPEWAWRFPEVEYGNAGSSFAALVLDCDDPRKMGLGLSDLPPFNWLVERPANDHAHVVWTLAKPVHRYPAARVEPLRYFARIAEYYAFATNADASYTGVLAHNPACRFKSPYRTTWGREAPYTLDQLASIIPFNWEPPRVRQTGVGRNCDLFEAGMTWAGRRANAGLLVLPALLAVNQNFAHPLPLSEVQATARSIEKYRKRWSARGWHCPRWIARQAARGRRSGEARHLGSNESLKPWAAEGVSRATWYRRRATERETRTNTDKGPESSVGDRTNQKKSMKSEVKNVFGKISSKIPTERTHP